MSSTQNTSGDMNREVLDLCDEFLRKYYREEIGELANKYPKDAQSLVIDWSDVFSFNPDLAWDIAEKPNKLRDYLEQSLVNFDIPIDVEFDDPRVRIENLVSDREMYVGGYEPAYAEELIGVTGQIRQISQSRPQLVTGRFECQRCGTLSEIPQAGTDLQEPHECQGCERQGPFRLDKSESTFRNHQLVRLELPPEHADGADKYIDAHLHGDISDQLQGSERVTLTGTLTMSEDENDGRDFPWRFDTDSIRVEEGGFDDLDYTEYQDEIEEIANKDDTIQYLVDNLDPDIYKDEKMELVCEALICGMVGAARNGTDRPDSHMFLVGDPGTAKSELLEAISDISPRSRYASGESVSGAGLTAAAQRTDFGPGEWTVKAGLLPRTNDGIVCIDELDKIPDVDKDKLHSALEKQQIDFAKAGEKATLPARTGLMAAGNPENGRFDQYEPVSEQIDLSPTMLSRFDLIFTMIDRPDEDHDENVADAVIEGWDTTDGDDGETKRDKPDDVYQAYIAYAREKVQPTATEEAKQRIKDKYVSLRSKAYGDDDSPVPLTARKLGALMRVAESSARARLSDTVDTDDAERAIKLVEQSMRDVGQDPETGEFDADVVASGISKSQRDRIKNIKGIIDNTAPEYDEGAPVDVVIERAEEVGIDESKAEHEIEKLKQKGEVYEPTTDHLRTS